MSADAGIEARLACDLVVSADGAMWRPDLPSVAVASRGPAALDVVAEGRQDDTANTQQFSTTSTDVIRFGADIRQIRTLSSDD